MFARAHRLRRSHAIIAALRRGARRSHGPLTCYLLPSQGSRVAVIVDTKVSKLAVRRNLIKRRIRAVLREVGLPQGDLVVRAQAGSVTLEYGQLKQHLTQCLRAVSSSH